MKNLLIILTMLLQPNKVGEYTEKTQYRKKETHMTEWVDGTTPSAEWCCETGIHHSAEAAIAGSAGRKLQMCVGYGAKMSGWTNHGSPARNKTSKSSITKLYEHARK